MPTEGSVLREVLLNGRHGCGLDRRRGGEIGFSGSQINHVNSLCFQLLGFLHYGHCRRSGNSPQSARKFHHNVCLSVMNHRDYIEDENDLERWNVGTSYLSRSR